MDRAKGRMTERVAQRGGEREEVRDGHSERVRIIKEGGYAVSFRTATWHRFCSLVVASLWDVCSQRCWGQIILFCSGKIRHTQGANGYQEYGAEGTVWWAAIVLSSETEKRDHFSPTRTVKLIPQSVVKTRPTHLQTGHNEPREGPWSLANGVEWIGLAGWSGVK